MGVRKIFAKAIENWPAKVLSLALAIILFIFHRMSVLETRYFFTPLVIEHMGIMTAASHYPRMIRVSLRGEAHSLDSILDNDIEAFIDMQNFAAPGTYNVPVQWRKKGTALGVEPLQISVDPMEIAFSLDRKISKFVPLVASFIGQVESGFNMTSHSMDPAQVIIEGPVSLMGSISELNTESIDLSGRTDSFSLTAAILNNEPLIIIRGSGTVEFFGTVSQIIPVRNISNVPIVVSDVREGFTWELETRTGSIHLEGDNLNAVERFVPPPDFLKVDCSGISEPGTYILRVLSGNAGGLSMRVEPQEVKIEISQTGDLEE